MRYLLILLLAGCSHTVTIEKKLTIEEVNKRSRDQYVQMVRERNLELKKKRQEKIKERIYMGYTDKREPAYDN